MKRSLVVLVVIALVLSTSAGFSRELPEAPSMGLVEEAPAAAAQTRPSLFKRIPVIDSSLFAGVVATHAGDWASTQQCLRISQEQEKQGLIGVCHESFLPDALVESKLGMGAYEATTAGLEIYAQHILTKYNRRRVGRIAQLANIGGTAYVVVHNYRTIQMAAHP